MITDREALWASWDRTRDHFDAALAHLEGRPEVDISGTLAFLEHNELGCAFSLLVHVCDDVDLPLAFWQHLDRAAREMRLDESDLCSDRKAADLCRRHLGADGRSRGTADHRPGRGPRTEPEGQGPGADQGPGAPGPGAPGQAPE